MCSYLIKSVVIVNYLQTHRHDHTSIQRSTSNADYFLSHDGYNWCIWQMMRHLVTEKALQEVQLLNPKPWNTRLEP